MKRLFLTSFLMGLLALNAPQAMAEQASSDLSKAETQALQSVDWFKAHFPEMMASGDSGTRLNQYSIEEASLPTANEQKISDAEHIS